MFPILALVLLLLARLERAAAEDEVYRHVLEASSCLVGLYHH